MNKHTLTIELAAPLEWVRVEKDEDIGVRRRWRHENP